MSNKPKQPNIKANINNPNNPNYINKTNNNNNKNKKKIRQRPNQFRYIRPNTFYPNLFKKPNPQTLINKYREGLKKYLISLLFPEDAVNSGYIAKQPSYISLPTASVVFKEQINFVINGERKFWLMWVPNFFSSKPDLQYHLPDPGSEHKLFYSHLYFKTDSFGGQYSEQFLCHTSYAPEISLSKYRLVSAKISVQYNGTVMNQSGQMYSCATYDDLPVLMGACDGYEEDVAVTFSGYQTTEKIKLSDYFDLEKVRNGLWPKYVNITSSVGQIDNIALPSDPTDHTFYPLSHYYQVEPNKIAQTGRESVDQKVLYAQSTDGGHLSYLYYGTGIPEGTNISVVVYYNFEVIPTQTTAPFMRASKQDPKITNFIGSKSEIINEKVNELASTTTKLLSDGDKGQVKNNLGTFVGNVVKLLVPTAVTAGMTAMGAPMMGLPFIGKPF